MNAWLVWLLAAALGPAGYGDAPAAQARARLFFTADDGTQTWAEAIVVPRGRFERLTRGDSELDVRFCATPTHSSRGRVTCSLHVCNGSQQTWRDVVVWAVAPKNAALLPETLTLNGRPRQSVVCRRDGLYFLPVAVGELHPGAAALINCSAVRGQAMKLPWE